eukprot:PhM_4_TR15910/c0_g1_i1/m.21298
MAMRGPVAGHLGQRLRVFRRRDLPLQLQVKQPREHHADEVERRAHDEDGAEVHRALEVQDAAHNEVQGHAEQVHDRRALRLWDVLRAQCAERRPEDADANLEQAELQRDQERALVVEADEAHHRARRRKEALQHRDVAHAVGLEHGVERSAERARQHEAGEDGAVGDGDVAVGRLQRRGPHEHERVHGALEEGLAQTEVQDLLLRHHNLDGAPRAGEDVCVGVAVVLAPREPHRDRRQHEHADGHVEGGDGVLHGVDRHLRHEAGGDGYEAVARDHPREGGADEIGVEAARVVLAHHPGLEGGPQDRRREATEDAAEHEHGVVVEMLRGAREDVGDAVHNTRKLAAVPVGDGAGPRAEDHRGPKTCDKQDAIVVARVAVEVVELVDVRALEPVRGHHEQVHGDEADLEAAEGGVVLLLLLGARLAAGLLREDVRVHADNADHERREEISREFTGLERGHFFFSLFLVVVQI